jgi:ubiquinone/menaquinone biosynthesis C-methylase UbiE
MALLRKGRPEDPLIVSITGARVGHRIVGVVGGDTRLFLDVAAKVGITGQAVALAADRDAAARVERAAVERGVLVEAVPIALPLPLADASFDIALVDERAPRAEAYQTAALSRDMLRVLRPGGRIVLAVAVPSSPFSGLFGIAQPTPDISPLLSTLTSAGFTAARLLAARGGVGFVEAARPA